jgi:cell division protein FtsQ
MIQRIAKKVFYILIPLGMIVLLGFVVETNESMSCRSFQVRIDSPYGIAFVDSGRVVKHVYDAMEPLDGKKLGSIPLNRIEELVDKMYYVEESRVYRTIDGHVVANIQQRTPIARVINSMNETFYIDDRGKLMKPSSSYTARVIVVTGFVHTRYSPNVNIQELSEEVQLTSSEKVLIELNTLIRHIQNNDFLNAWIDQIYVNRKGEFELVPRNGAHTIVLGNTENMEPKFNKLMKFYKFGLTQVGWGSYKRINLKYKNQVVCSK